MPDYTFVTNSGRECFASASVPIFGSGNRMHPQRLAAFNGGSASPCARSAPGGQGEPRRGERGQPDRGWRVVGEAEAFLRSPQRPVEIPGRHSRRDTVRRRNCRAAARNRRSSPARGRGRGHGRACRPWPGTASCHRIDGERDLAATVAQAGRLHRQLHRIAARRTRAALRRQRRSGASASAPGKHTFFTQITSPCIAVADGERTTALLKALRRPFRAPCFASRTATIAISTATAADPTAPPIATPVAPNNGINANAAAEHQSGTPAPGSRRRCRRVAARSSPFRRRP